MKAKILIVAVSIIIMIACSKDKFSTKPTLTLESVSGDEFVVGQNISIKLKLTDKEGDFEVADSSSNVMKPYLFYKRLSPLCVDNDTATHIFDLPAFSSHKFLDADLVINFTYGLSPAESQYTPISRCGTQRDDSTYFRFWIKDEAGNVSDTINTPAFKLLL